MPESTLPSAFRDLELWSAWALPSELERSNRRQASTMTELRAFYDAMMRRIDDVLQYLDQFPLDQTPPDARLLSLLTFSLAEIAPAIEQFGQVAVVDSYDSNDLRCSEEADNE